MQGLSLTSLKSACRRLGLPRWPYDRSREALTAGGSPPSSSPPQRSPSASPSGSETRADSEEELAGAELGQQQLQLQQLEEVQPSPEEEGAFCGEDGIRVERGWVSRFVRSSEEEMLEVW